MKHFFSNVVSNLPGQSWVLQETVFSLVPEQDPPLLSGTVLYLVKFCDPTPQLLEHLPLGVQLDHWQSTEDTIKRGKKLKEVKIKRGKYWQIRDNKKGDKDNKQTKNTDRI